MKRKTFVFGVLVLLMIAYVQMGTADVLAQTGGPYDLSWSSIDGGGQASAGGSYWVGSTTGQPDAGGVLTGGTFELTGGFWSFQEGNPTAVTLASFTATPQGDGVLVQWETAAEVDNVGFNLYRAQSPSGDWVRLNTTLIPSQAPGSVFGATYTWLDEDVETGLTYYYKLEDVEVGGGGMLHGPILVQAGGPTSVALRAFSTDRALGRGLLASALMVIFGVVLLRRAQRARRCR